MELAVGLIGVFVGALVTIAGQVYQSRASNKEADEKQRRTDVGATTRTLMKVLQAQQWWVWHARKGTEANFGRRLDSYNARVENDLGEMIAELGVLAATWPDAYSRLRPLSDYISYFDESIGQAGVAFGSEPESGRQTIAALYEDVLPFHAYVYEQVDKVANLGTVDDYDPEAVRKAVQAERERLLQRTGHTWSEDRQVSPPMKRWLG